jgi:single-stranded-DNA-specific exonuclease
MSNIIELLQEDFNNRDLNKTVKDLPPIEGIANISITAQRLHKAIKSNESMFLIFDLDADSLTAYAIFYHYMKQIGYSNYYYHTYSRNDDGYGSNLTKIKEQYQGQSLVFYNDIGTSANKQVDWFIEQGADVCIIDHHEPSSSLPRTYFIVNTNSGICDYPLKNLCAGDTLFLTLVEVNKLLGKPVNMNNDLFVISTISHISDMMSLTGNYRPFIKLGLSKFKDVTVPFLKVLYDEIFGRWNKEVTAMDVSFSISPLLNSTHRNNVSYLAKQFIEAKDYSEALDLYNQLKANNNKRKAIVNSINPIVDDSDNVIITTIDESISKGFTGLIANKIANSYNKPTLVYRKSGDVWSGSGRSPNGILFKDLVNESGLAKGQGHQEAFGSSISPNNIDKLKDYLNKKIDLSQIKTSINSYELNPLEITYELIDTLEMFEPTGIGNEKPVFHYDISTLDYSIEYKGNYSIINIENVKGYYFGSDKLGLLDSIEYTIESKYKIIVQQIVF